MKPVEQTSHTMPLPPDAYVAMAVLAAVVGELFVPVPLLPEAAIFGPLTLPGLAMGASGLWLEISAARALTAAATSTRPNGAASALVTNGVFRRSRNPFYLGILLLVAGAMLAFSLDWGLLLIPLLWLALDLLVVPVEERRLEAAFGQDFRDYAVRTRRWL